MNCPKCCCPIVHDNEKIMFWFNKFNNMQTMRRVKNTEMSKRIRSNLCSLVFPRSIHKKFIQVRWPVLSCCPVHSFEPLFSYMYLANPFNMISCMLMHSAATLVLTNTQNTELEGLLKLGLD